MLTLSPSLAIRAGQGRELRVPKPIPRDLEDPEFSLDKQAMRPEGIHAHTVAIESLLQCLPRASMAVPVDRCRGVDDTISIL